MELIIDCGTAIELTYDDNGRFEYAKKFDTGEYLKFETITQGLGYKIDKNKTLSLGECSVCDARYVRIIDFDIFVPKFVYIKNK
jgi:hypothetical protein